MHAPDPILGLMDCFTAAINAQDLDAVLALDGAYLTLTSATPRSRPWCSAPATWCPCTEVAA